MSKETVALIDYGAGNVRSVFNALKFLGADVNLTADAAEIRRASRVVLPGVGAFGDCVRGGQPFLGICVGYQMLFEESEESPDVRGLGFFPGKVKRFATPGLKVPQIGWNALDLTPHPLWKNLGEHPQVYFVHSYYCEPVDSSLVIGRTTYGETFAAAAAKGSVAGVQFHPEKSQDVGLGILRNFLQMEAR
jgi:imidazole glycerol-phosphate synthase subunit HisH